MTNNLSNSYSYNKTYEYYSYFFEKDVWEPICIFLNWSLEQLLKFLKISKSNFYRKIRMPTLNNLNNNQLLKPVFEIKKIINIIEWNISAYNKVYKYVYEISKNQTDKRQFANIKTLKLYIEQETNNIYNLCQNICQNQLINIIKNKFEKINTLLIYEKNN